MNSSIPKMVMAAAGVAALSRHPMRVRQRGFTLVEVMVALLVLGIALPALLSQIVTQVDASAYLRDKMLAAWVAQDQLEQLRLQQSLQGRMAVGEIEGERRLAQRDWYWTVVTEATPMPGILRQTVAVALVEGEPLLSLSAYTLPRALVPGPVDGSAQ